MTSLQDRLKYFLTSIDLPMQQFERRCGIGQGLGSKLSLKSYATTFKRIARAFPELNIDWLKTGEGEMLKPVAKFQQSNSGGNNQQIEKVGSHADLRTGTFYESCPENYQHILKLEKDIERLRSDLAHKEDIIGQMKKTESSQSNRIVELKERISELKERFKELKSK